MYMTMKGGAMSSMQQVFTPQQVAEYLQVSPETIYRYIKEGKLVASRFGRTYRIPQRNVELFLLATSTVGGASLRPFSGDRIAEWFEEDQIDQETRATGKRLLDFLG